MISVIWFLYWWKSNVFICMFMGKMFINLERECYLIMDWLLLIGLFVLGGMVFVEVCGVVV